MGLLNAARRLGLRFSAASRTEEELTRRDMRALMGNLDRRTLDNSAEAATEILDLAQRPGREWAIVATPRSAGREVRGDAYSVDIPAYELRDPSSYIHHSHPYRAAADDLQAVFPLSDADLQMLRHRNIKGVASYEPDGGTGYASRGGKAGHSRADSAIEAAFVRAGEKMNFGDELLPVMKARVNEKKALRIRPEQDVSAIAAGRALKRVGLLGRYSYEPGTRAQMDLLLEAAPFMRAAEWAALRAAHGKIYGLPHPLTWGRLGGAGALGYGAYETLT